MRVEDKTWLYNNTVCSDTGGLILSPSHIMRVSVSAKPQAAIWAVQQFFSSAIKAAYLSPNYREFPLFSFKKKKYFTKSTLN